MLACVEISCEGKIKNREYIRTSEDYASDFLNQ